VREVALPSLARYNCARADTSSHKRKLTTYPKSWPENSFFLFTLLHKPYVYLKTFIYIDLVPMLYLFKNLPAWRNKRIPADPSQDIAERTRWLGEREKVRLCGTLQNLLRKLVRKAGETWTESGINAQVQHIFGPSIESASKF
jgi:hypothetical protein